MELSLLNLNVSSYRLESSDDEPLASYISVPKRRINAHIVPTVLPVIVTKSPTKHKAHGDSSNAASMLKGSKPQLAHKPELRTLIATILDYSTRLKRVRIVFMYSNTHCTDIYARAMNPTNLWRSGRPTLVHYMIESMITCGMRMRS